MKAYFKKHLVTLRSAFAVSVSLLLLLTAIAKTIAIVQHKPFLQRPDGVFPHLTKGDSLMLAIVGEVLVAVFMIIRSRHVFSMVVCSWLVACFVSYRLTYFLLAIPGPCGCLGGVLDWTSIPRPWLNIVPLLLLCYMGIGSLFFLLAGGVPEKLNRNPDAFSATTAHP